jgi:subtilisin family serine protease
MGSILGTSGLRVTALASAIFACGIGATSTTAQAAGFAQQAVVGSDDSTTMALNADVFIVQFDEPPLAMYRGTTDGLSAPEVLRGGLREGRVDVKGAASQAYVEHIQELQADYRANMSHLLGREPQLMATMQHAFNGIIVRLRPGEAERVRAMPGVSRVEGYSEYFTSSDRGPDLIGAPLLWSGGVIGDSLLASGFEAGETPPLLVGGNRAEGIVIGVIDGGINFDSPSYAATAADGYVHINPLAPGTSLGTCLSGGLDAGLCNDKLIGAYDFAFPLACPTGTCAANILENPGVEDLDGHGSHTSSTAAGNAVVASFRGNQISISGVAPRANIIAYDTCWFNTTANNGPCGGPAVVQAVNQAVADGVVDVINYSISGGTQPWTDTLSQAFLAAHEAGIYVAAAAGNAGPGPSTTSHATPWVTTVGASTHSRGTIGFFISANGPGTPPAATQNILMNLGTAGTEIAATIAPTTSLITSPAFLANVSVTDDGCVAYPAGTFAGSIALIRRGGCQFAIKAQNAVAAGAVAVVIANNDPNANVGIIPSGTPPVAVPVFGITRGQAEALRQFDVDSTGPVTAGVPFPATQVVDTPDVMAGFSSRGPALFDLLKPDVTAPGVQVLAAVSGVSSAYGLLSGTSMASPHTAGAAALLRKAHPSWTPSEIKSALVMTGKTDAVFKENGTTPADPWDRGGGRIQVAAAQRAGLVLNETGLNYQNANPATPTGRPTTLNLASIQNGNCSAQCTFTRRVRSTLATSETWTATVVGAPGTVTPATFVMGPGDQRNISVSVDTSAIAPGAYAFGEVVLTATGSVSPVLRMPVALRRGVQDIDLNPTSFALTAATGTTGTATLGVRNTGGDPLTWAIPATGSLTVPLMSQSSQNNNGFLSSFLGGQTPAPVGAYVAEDVVTLADSSVTTIAASGFVLGAASFAAINPSAITFKIYNSFGVPAGNPEAGAAGEIYSCSRTLAGPTNGGLSVIGAGQLQTLSLDLTAAAAAACPAVPTLAPGSYWVSVYVTVPNNATGGRWFNFVTLAPTNNNGQIISPSGVLGPSTWTSLASQSTFDGFAMTVSGNVDCSLPAWLTPSVTAGTTAGGGSTPVTLNINTAGLAAGVYRANVCVTSNDADEASLRAPVVLTVQ